LGNPETSLNWKITKAHYIALFYLLAAHSTNSKSFKKVEDDKKNTSYAAKLHKQTVKTATAKYVFF